MENLLIISISNFVIGFDSFAQGSYHLKFTQGALVDRAYWIVDEIWRDKKSKSKYLSVVLYIFF